LRADVVGVAKPVTVDCFDDLLDVAAFIFLFLLSLRDDDVASDKLVMLW
jgi:hypothetical protein